VPLKQKWYKYSKFTKIFVNVWLLSDDILVENRGLPMSASGKGKGMSLHQLLQWAAQMKLKYCNYSKNVPPIFAQ
jgi:hypothetical protein